MPKPSNDRHVELLAPAGSLESAKAALEAGADAIYAGVTNLSMRPKRVEFTDDMLVELVAFTHSLGKRIFITANTCVKDADWGLLEYWVEKIAAAGADAIIMSDVAAMRFVVANYPELPVHVSVMSTVANAESARFYEELGASVVVVARSVGDLEEVRKIREAVGIGLEVFVHGGICYIYDGNCYMSSYWKQEMKLDPDLGRLRPFGQNNSKGECHLICKRKFSLTQDGKEIDSGLLLRRDDMVGLDLIPAYLDLGVSIFKIEGRAMSLDYIRDGVRLYREAIDLALADPSRYAVREEWAPAVAELLRARFDYERAWHIG